MEHKNDYLSFNFEKFDEAGLKKIVTAFRKKDIMVTAVEATNKAKREAGVQTKKAILHLADGQKLTLQITSNGAIFQVRLNSTVIPVKHTDNLRKAVAEVADKITSNSKKFQQALAKKANRATSAGRDSSARAATSIKAQLALAKSSKDELQDVVNGLLERKEELEQDLNLAQGEQSKLTSSLNSEMTITEQLEAELAALEAA